MDSLENKVIRERIHALRQNMKSAGVHYYLVVTADPHGSEYINEHYKEREFLSGFTGSNGDLLIGEEECLLWTDGRYFVQAERELEGTGILLMKSRQQGVPDLEEYLKSHIKEGMKLGLYGFCLNAAMGKRLEKIMETKQGEVVYRKDLADAVFTDRPADSAAPIRILDDSLTGESSSGKILRVRKKMEEQGADHLLISKLEDQMWLFNIRGGDIACNPVAYAFTLILKEKTIVYLKEESVAELRKKAQNGEGLYAELQKKAQMEGNAQSAKCETVEWRPYRDFVKELPKLLRQSEKSLGRRAKVMLDPAVVNYTIYRTVKEYADTVEAKNPTEVMKAVKNPVEIGHIKQAYLLDSVALTRYIRYIKEHRTEGLTESEAADILEQYRRGVEGFQDLSFPTISAYGANAAMMHYEAVPGRDTAIKPEGIYLVDSGGQYEGGTTDVTRSIVMGSITQEMKKHYTLTAMGMLRLQNAVFLHGCTGRNLDILAREPLWQQKMDYKCGTGHGVGYMLSVHEGPQNISWRPGQTKEAVMEEGMLVSDEPGVYLAGNYGIRIENILLCEKRECNEDGQFMGFCPLTLAPLDLEGIDPSYMERSDIEALNRYHQTVYERLSPYLSEEENAWLREQTKNVEAAV